MGLFLVHNCWRVALPSILLISLGTLQNTFGQTDDEPDTLDVELPFPFEDNDPMPQNNTGGGLYLDNPSNINSTVEYDPVTGNYEFQQTIGDDTPYRAPTYMDQDDYRDWEMKQAIKEYWDEKSTAEKFNEEKAGFRPQLNIDNQVFDKIFGGNTIDIRPQG